MMSINEMSISNGHTTYNGVEYVLLRQAYTNDGETYTAPAIRPDELDKADKDGWVPCYEVTWGVTDPDAETEDVACDWDDPASVTATCEYNIRSGRIC